MLNLNSIMLGSSDQPKLAKFYTEVLGRPADMTESGWDGWSVGSSFLSIGDHSQVKGHSSEPERVMFNFETPDVKAEFERISKIEGVRIIKEPYMMGEKIMIATLGDPDGNYFQLMSPWE